MALLTSEAWDRFVEDHPEAHILQTSPWGELKSAFGWQPRYVLRGTVGALVLFRRLPLGISIGYIPRGPIGSGDLANDFWPALDDLCKKERAIFLRVEPNVWEPVSDDFYHTHLTGFVPSEQTIQPPRTLLIDLEKDEDEILMAMKSKTRYNIRLAARKDVLYKKATILMLFTA